MAFWRQLRYGIQHLVDRKTADRDAADEVAHFLERATAEGIARGLAPEAARRAAQLEIGSTTAAKETIRSYGWEHLVDTVAADLRYAVRVLIKTPAFTAVSIFVIALGTGAVTTIFSAMNAIVLRPIPTTTDPRRLVQIDRRLPDRDDGIQASRHYYNYLRERTRTLTGLAAWSKASFSLSRGGEGIAVYGNLVSGNYFSVLGVRPALGRFFAAEEDGTPLSHPVMVVSHGFWTARLGGDSAVVGQKVSVNGQPYTIVGVAPPRFSGVFTPIQVEAWVPLAMQQHLRPGRDLEQSVWLWTFGRLEPGADRAGAQRELAALTARYIGDKAEPAGRAGFTTIRLGAMNGLPADAHAMALGFISLLLGAAVLVLLIASVNVGSMLSARALARRREIAVRAALGASRIRLVRQLLTEILLLFAAGAAGGAVLAIQATSALERIPIPADVPLVLEISPDGRVFLFTILLSLATGLIFGLAPAVRAARVDLAARLRDGAPGGGTRRRILGDALIVGQLALSLVLLVAAGLFLRALDRGARTDPGFELAGVTTATFNAESWGYDRDRGQAFYETLRERIGALPGVTAVSFTNNMPLAFATSNGWIRLDATPPEVGAEHRGEPILLALAGPGYFASLAMPLVAGRPIEVGDDENAPRVAVVNETFAKRYWSGESALGRSFWQSGNQFTVVGVARDAKYGSLSEITPAFAYFPIGQRWISNQVMLVRSTLPELALAPAIREAVLGIDPQLPPPVITTLRESSGIVLLPQRIAAIVTAVLGGVGLVLATVGLYGIIAYSVGGRTREIGLRVALGADRAAVLRLIVTEGLRLAVIGVVIGLVLAALAGRLLAGLLFSVSPLDLMTFATMSVLFLGVASLASYLPARRAARADPMTALRVD